MKKLMILAKSLVNSAGMEKMTVEFANAMICNGYAVEILLQDSNIESFYKLDSSINISSLHSYSLYSIYSIKKIRKIVLESKVDYLINIGVALSRLSLVALWNTKVKVITWEHFNLYAGSWLGFLWRLISVRFSYKTVVLTNEDYRAYRKFVSCNFKEVISITKGTADNLKKWAGIESKVIYNGICLDKIIHFAAKGISRQTLNIPEDAFLCVMVARFNEQKDQDTVIRAMKKLPLNFYLLLVGSGERQIVCEKLVEEIEVSERVCFVGYSQYPSIYISISDVGILSSHWEGFGISALEYMALGKPTVVTNVDGLKEVVGNAALLFTPHNENELADKIYALYCDRILYNRMKVISKLHVLNFDVKETARQYLVEYQKFF